ncbi:MAG TPA: DNA alkylation repair protein [Candidatus Limnocylindria bacterium]
MIRGAAAEAAGIEARLREVGTPERAMQEQRYLKSSLQFVGATVWQIRAVVKRYLAEADTLDHDALIALVDALWAQPVHERRMAAVAILEERSSLLGAGDLPVVERLIRESLTWALIDGIAADVVGDILVRDEATTVRTLDRWAADADFWVRRSALLAWLRPLRMGAPLDRFLTYADRMLEEREFFIRKAIGWVLRDVGKRRPESVVDWLAPRTHRASGVTMREATKYLPRADRERLLLAYRERRPA